MRNSSTATTDQVICSSHALYPRPQSHEWKHSMWMHSKLCAYEKKEQKNMLKGDMKGPLTVWQSLNEIIPVFIWVTSNYAASIKPLWPHILAPTPHPHKNMCTRTHTQTRLRAHTCPLQTLSGFVHDTVFHKYLQAHMHFIVFAHDCRSYVNINGNPQDVSQSALATLTHSYT